VLPRTPGLNADAPVFLPVPAPGLPSPGAPDSLTAMCARLLGRIQTLERELKTVTSELRKAEDEIRELWATHPVRQKTRKGSLTLTPKDEPPNSPRGRPSSSSSRARRRTSRARSHQK